MGKTTSFFVVGLSTENKTNSPCLESLSRFITSLFLFLSFSTLFLFFVALLERMISCFSLRDFAQFSLQYFNVNDNSHINSESNIFTQRSLVKKKKIRCIWYRGL